MTVTLPSLAKLKPNTAYASLPLFDRTGWKRVRFGDVENLNVAGTRGSKEPDVWKFADDTIEEALFWDKAHSEGSGMNS